MEVGEIFSEAVIRRLDPSVGLLLELKTDPQLTAGYAHVRVGRHVWRMGGRQPAASPPFYMFTFILFYFMLCFYRYFSNSVRPTVKLVFTCSYYLILFSGNFFKPSLLSLSDVSKAARL